MDDFDEDYINEEARAHITIRNGLSGSFHFGLVQGEIDSELVDCNGKKRLEFTFEATDEMDPVSGSGWVELKSRNEITGRFKFHCRDSHSFHARRVRVKKMTVRHTHRTK